MLVAEGLRKRYRSREVVRDFGLTLDAGEVVGLLGPNGAGKTTCFYMIVGLVPADAGRIVLDGVDITERPMYARAQLGVGYLPQEPSVFRKLSVADNIRLVLELRPDLDDDGRERELSALLDELQINHVADQSGASLSGGERRRVEIARALAGKPRMILLDEPFAGVDPISVNEIQRIVRHLKERGIGVLITDHNVRETLGICDRAYILADGAAPSDRAVRMIETELNGIIYDDRHIYLSSNRTPVQIANTLVHEICHFLNADLVDFENQQSNPNLVSHNEEVRSFAAEKMFERNGSCLRRSDIKAIHNMVSDLYPEFNDTGDEELELGYIYSSYDSPAN